MTLINLNLTVFGCKINVQTWFTSMSMYRLLEGDIFVVVFLASIKITYLKHFIKFNISYY